MHCKVVQNRRGNKPWAVDYTDSDGKRRLQSFTSKKAADARKLEIMNQLEIGVHVAARATLTVSELLDEFLIECERRNKIGDRMTGGTLRNYRNCIEFQIRPGIGKVKLSSLSGIRCQELINDVAGEHQYRHVLVHCILKLALGFAVTRGWLKRSPLTDEKMRLPIGRKQRVRVATKTELRALLHASETQLPKEREAVHEIRRAVILLGLFAGLRRGEICGLQWGNLDFVNGLINVRHNFSDTDGLKETKTRHGLRDVPMVPATRKALEVIGERNEWPRDGYVMTPPGGSPLSLYGNLYMHYFALTMRKAGLLQEGKRTPLFSFHSLRHTYASLLIASAVPIIEVSRMMGHAKVTTTLEVYGHLYEEDGKGRSAMEAISDDLTPAITSRSMRQRCDGNGQLIEFQRAS